MRAHHHEPVALDHDGLEHGFVALGGDVLLVGPRNELNLKVQCGVWWNGAAAALLPVRLSLQWG